MELKVMAGERQICFFMDVSADDLKNANLIASAQELYEALKLAILKNEHDMLMTGEELRKCNAALEKADGQS